MFSSLPLPILLAIFAAAAVAVWVAGVQLSNSTDVLADRLHLGEALGGLLLLAIATNLPEIAITISAALSNNIGLIVGNILGGIAIQTVVLVVLDWVGVRDGAPISYRAASLVLVLEATLVIAVLVMAIIGTQLPAGLMFFRVTPENLLIVVLWVAGIWALNKAGKGLPWQDTQGNPPDGQDKPIGAIRRKRIEQAKTNKQSTVKTALIFAGAAVVTLIAGVLLEESGDAMSSQLNLSGVIFGATVLAAATSLPELSTGIASVRLGDYQLAFSDIFGGNAFLPVLFLLAGILSNQAILPQAQKTDIYLAALGILLSAVYIYGLIFRPRKTILGMGVDSLIVLGLFVIGMLGFVVIALNSGSA